MKRKYPGFKYLVGIIYHCLLEEASGISVIYLNYKLRSRDSVSRDSALCSPTVFAPKKRVQYPFWVKRAKLAKTCYRTPWNQPISSCLCWVGTWAEFVVWWPWRSARNAYKSSTASEPVVFFYVFVIWCRGRQRYAVHIGDQLEGKMVVNRYTEWGFDA